MWNFGYLTNLDFWLLHIFSFFRFVVNLLFSSHEEDCFCRRNAKTIPIKTVLVKITKCLCIHFLIFPPPKREHLMAPPGDGLQWKLLRGFYIEVFCATSLSMLN